MVFWNNSSFGLENGSCPRIIQPATLVAYLVVYDAFSSGRLFYLQYLNCCELAKYVLGLSKLAFTQVHKKSYNGACSSTC